MIDISQNEIPNFANLKSCSLTNSQISTKSQLTSSDIIIWYCINYPEKISFIKENIKLKKYISKDLELILENWSDIINTFEIDKKNKYIWISQNNESLEIKAQIENTTIKNDETIENDILRAISKLDNDLLSIASQILKQKMNQWEPSAFEEYKELLKIKK